MRIWPSNRRYGRGRHGSPPQGSNARRKTGAHLTVSLRGAGPVWGDYASLYRLLWILIENAAKFTPAPGSINLTMIATSEKVTVTVQDNGIGISATDLPNIFHRFYRADPSRSQVEGSGLGLAIAKRIVEMHRAHLTVDSKENAGSTFEIVFPVFTASSPLPAPVRTEPILKG